MIAFKRIFIIFSLFGIFASSYSCAQKNKGSGNVVKQERQTGPFHSLEINGIVNVYITQGDNESIVVETDDNLQDAILTENNNDRLVIKEKKGVFEKFTKVNVYVTVTNLSKLEVSGISNVECQNQLQTEKLDVDISGTGNITLDVNCQILKTDISGVGNVNLKGEAKNAVIEKSGAGSLRAFELTVQTLEIENSGIGNAEVTAVKEISIESSGAGNLHYKGDPVVKKLETSGIGHVKKVE